MMELDDVGIIESEACLSGRRHKMEACVSS
jgi:hypothetical protein